METPTIPKDDLIDVIELTKKIHDAVSEVLDDVDHPIAMSAIMSSFVNLMIAQCDNLGELMFNRNIFVNFVDSTIMNIKTDHEKGKPQD